MKKNIQIALATVCLLFSLVASAFPGGINSAGYYVPSNNPHEGLSDKIPWKAEAKEMSDWGLGEYSPLGTPYNTIIPATPNHGCWILGILLTEDTFQNLPQNLQNDSSSATTHIVSMITDTEVGNWYSNLNYPFHRLRWFDHGTINTDIGKNETVESMFNFQNELYKEFYTADPNVSNLFYCHCNAGRSRSVLETMAFIFFYPGKETLFDFNSYKDKWKEINFGNNPENLKPRLLDNPSFTDINEFVRLQRPEAKELLELDGDQAGLVGLLSLSKWAMSPVLIKERELARLYIDAEDIGLMLKAPLDSGFRDPADIEQQVENLVKVYNAFKERGINLFIAMIEHHENTYSKLAKTMQDEFNKLSASKQAFVIHANLTVNFKNNFDALSASEQAHFAILMKRLEKKCDLHSISTTPKEFAKTALEHDDNTITTGDQVELLRTFGNLAESQNYDSAAKEIAKKIISKPKIADNCLVRNITPNNYNAGIQLAELYQIVEKKHKEDIEIINSGKDIPVVGVHLQDKSYWARFSSMAKKAKKIVIGNQPNPSSQHQYISVEKYIKNIINEKSDIMDKNEEENFNKRLKELNNQVSLPHPMDINQSFTESSNI